MSFAELIGRLSKPDSPAIAVSRHAVMGAGTAFLLLAVWAVASGWYFLFRDDVAAHFMARQSAMQQAYEEKIGALRVHLDRLASQNLVDQDGLDRRVSELMARQAQLETRQTILANLSDRSVGPLGTASLQEPLSSAVTLPAAPSSGTQAERRKPTPASESFGLRLRGSDTDAPAGKRRTSEQDNKAPLRDRIAYLQNSLATLESTQMRALDQLLRTAETKASRLRDAVREAGLNPEALDTSTDKGGMGGPLVPVTTGADAGPFESLVERVQTSVERLEHLDRATVTLPFGRPMPGDVDLTSAFGYRIDPFTRGPALHTGLDFKAEHGAPVRASGAGQVVSAEYTGGYGNMVEIDHGNGVTTRYAHLSAILVSVGQPVTAGAIVGRAGSTGRSTGAHLHYETRIDGEAVDPQRFLRAGSRLAAAN
jgi:murein DD-endopeptidase MepM/ murein hydrolase activator NlpD